MGCCKNMMGYVVDKIGIAGITMISALVAMGLGILLRSTMGEMNPDAIKLLEIPGFMWLYGLRCAVLPLIICSIMISMQSIKKLESGGFLIGATITFYVATTLMAALNALLWFYLVLEPNLHAVPFEEYDDQPEPPGTLVDQVVLIFGSFVPNNIVVAYAENNVVGIIVVSIAIGLLINDTEEGSSVMMAVVRELNGVIMKIMEAFITVTPIAVFFLVLPQAAALDLAEAGSAFAYYLLTLLLAFASHLFILLPAVFFGFTRKNPFKYLSNCTEAIVTAFATSSSAATLPVTMRCVVEKNGVNEGIASFALPLGATINMNGTCVALVMAVCWMAAAQGEPLDVPRLVILVLLSVLSSVGAAPVPNSSLVMLLLILETLDVSTTSLFALYTAIDWLPDRFRSVINIAGDAFVCGIVDQIIDKNSLKTGLLEVSSSRSSFVNQFNVASVSPFRSPSQLMHHHESESDGQVEGFQAEGGADDNYGAVGGHQAELMMPSRERQNIHTQKVGHDNAK
eukprot:gb/GEZN01006008.1/.p1 GENE.gb/GEZN01006008.1/~~gb/GEZN01006008.1/.p1  ORF type:complete len:512 (-),score=73.05 gb/GEZN01006008.1/:154-1689(-)